MYDSQPRGRWPHLDDTPDQQERIESAIWKVRVVPAALTLVRGAILAVVRDLERLVMECWDQSCLIIIRGRVGRLQTIDPSARDEGAAKVRDER